MQKQNHALHSPDRAAAVLALLVTAGTHVPLVREHLEEAPYVGWLFIGLAAGSVLLALALWIRDAPLVWVASGMLASAAVLAFLVSRTAGLPGIGDDIGNWTEPLSYPALAAEAITAFAAVDTLVRARAARRAPVRLEVTPPGRGRRGTRSGSSTS
jgi:hypothetical protein